MSNRITITNLRHLVEYLNCLTGSPATAYTRDASGDLRANIGHYHVDTSYGGYALDRMVNESGGVTTVLHRGSARDLYERIHAYLRGWEDRAKAEGGAR